MWILEETKKRAARLAQLISVKRMAALYLAFLVGVIIVALVLVIEPRLEKGDGWLGVVVQPDWVTGKLIVTEVIADSPANNVGILPGDRILSYQNVAVPDIKTLEQMVRETYIRQKVRIVIERGTSRLVADTVISQRPKGVDAAPALTPMPERVGSFHGTTIP